MKVTETVYSGRVIKVLRRADQQRPDRYFEMVAHPGSAAVVAVTEGGRLVLVNQFREAVGGFLLEIPAGKLETGEPPDGCARRELEEETGYLAGRLEEMCSMFVTPGYCDEKIHIFSASGLTPSTANPDDDEVLAPVEVDFVEALRMIDDGRIRDAKTIVGILEYVRKNKWSLGGASGPAGPEDAQR